ncbi:MAG: hypothetical protein IJK84_09665 [Bacteroidales bacterium]|nr:hypothetical protein [Bacteroidales bacterium]
MPTQKIILILLFLGFTIGSPQDFILPNSQFSILNSLSAQEIGVVHNEQGSVVSSSHGVVDADDRLAVLITYSYDSVGVVETRSLQSYDRHGRPMRKEVYTVDEYLLFTEDNRYDRHGNRIRCVQTTYDEDGRPDRVVYKYRYRRQPDNTWALTSMKINGIDVLSEE